MPLTFSASKRKILNSWDRFLLPYPFSKGVFIWGAPIVVDQNEDRAHLEEKRILLENRLNELTERADHYFESPHPIPLPQEERGGRFNSQARFSATIVMWLAAPALETPLQIPQRTLTWVAILWLGILGSGLALILWYYLLHEIGPTRTGMVTYIFPLGGVILGVIFLNEHLSWQLAVGALLIISSMIVVNWKRKQADEH